MPNGHTFPMKKATRDSFWARLTEAMKDKGKKPTQVAAGAIVGVRQTSARKWATGGFPEMGTAIKLATELGVSVEWLLTGRGSKHPAGADDEQLREVLWLWVRLDAEKKGDLLKAARLYRMMSSGADPERYEQFEAALGARVHDRR